MAADDDDNEVDGNGVRATMMATLDNNQINYIVNLFTL